MMMKTVYLRAATRAALLAGLPFVRLERVWGMDEAGNPVDTGVDEAVTNGRDPGRMWDLTFQPPGSIVTATRDATPDDDLETLDILHVRNPAYAPLNEDGTDNPDPGAPSLTKVVTARSTDWHANLQIYPGATVEAEIAPAIILADPPATPQHGFAPGGAAPARRWLDKATLIRDMTPAEVAQMEAALDAYPDRKLAELYRAVSVFDILSTEFPNLAAAFVQVLGQTRADALLQPER